MISILSSEGLAPSQAAPKPNKLSGNPDKSPETSEETSFSSLVSQGSSEEAQKQDQPDPRSETPATHTPGLSSERVAARPNIDLAATDTIAPEAPNAATPDTPDIATVESDGKLQVDADLTRVATAETETLAPETAKVETGRTQTPATSAEPGTAAPIKSAPGATAVEAAEAKPTPDAPDPRPAATVPATGELQAEADPRAEPAKRGGAATAETPPQAPLVSQRAGDSDDALRLSRPHDAIDQPVPEARTSQFSNGADLGANGDKALQSVVKQVVGTPNPTGGFSEALVSVAPTHSAAPQVAPSGLTPIAPSIPVASPSELSAVILNAMKNGVDPQEQLIVQLDPPELGRVSIDFKFDAQGVQQITVTSENPEALKRLRELHFELAEALKDHGLSEKNMSFRQQSEGQSQPRWQMPELAGSNAPQPTADEAQIITQAARSNARLTHPDRLDLTL